MPQLTNKAPASKPGEPTELADKPPILNSWNNIYAIVLSLHVLIIILFYLFSRAYA